MLFEASRFEKFTKIDLTNEFSMGYMSERKGKMTFRQTPKHTDIVVTHDLADRPDVKLIICQCPKH